MQSSGREFPGVMGAFQNNAGAKAASTVIVLDVVHSWVGKLLMAPNLPLQASHCDTVSTWKTGEKWELREKRQRSTNTKLILVRSIGVDQVANDARFTVYLNSFSSSDLSYLYVGQRRTEAFINNQFRSEVTEDHSSVFNPKLIK
jgi:hypothetical protein